MEMGQERKDVFGSKLAGRPSQYAVLRVFYHCNAVELNLHLSRCKKVDNLLTARVFVKFNHVQSSCRAVEKSNC